MRHSCLGDGCYRARSINSHNVIDHGLARPDAHTGAAALDRLRQIEVCLKVTLTPHGIGPRVVQQGL